MAAARNQFAIKKPVITITQPAMNPKTMMRFSPFLSRPVKLSKDQGN